MSVCLRKVIRPIDQSRSMAEMSLCRSVWKTSLHPYDCSGACGLASFVSILIVVATMLTSACSQESGVPQSVSAPKVLRIYHSPYRGVDWAAGLRLKGQHHDHPGIRAERILAYDAAGYDAIVLADYSGSPDKPYALNSRLWPPEEVLPESLRESLTSIKFFIPGAEEVGFSDHYTSPFLTSYVERWLAEYSPQKQAWQYSSIVELAEIVRAGGGLLLMAHPWNAGDVIELNGLAGMEIFTAFAEARRRAGVADFVSTDRNQIMLDNWDRALVHNQEILGIAVNDHFGPLPEQHTDADIKDSGKIIVFAESATLEAYRRAFEQRAVLAIRDMGVTKGRYPELRSISVGTKSITIDTTGSVVWLARGGIIGDEHTLAYAELPNGATYVRAEVRSADGTVVIYTQAFSVRPVGDVDADGDVDVADSRICGNVIAGEERDPDRIAACG